MIRPLVSCSRSSTSSGSGLPVPRPVCGRCDRPEPNGGVGAIGSASLERGLDRLRRAGAIGLRSSHDLSQDEIRRGECIGLPKDPHRHVAGRPRPDPPKRDPTFEVPVRIRTGLEKGSVLENRPGQPADRPDPTRVSPFLPSLSRRFIRPDS